MAKLDDKQIISEKNAEKYKAIAETLGFSVNNIIYAHQKHTDNILVCDKKFIVGTPYMASGNAAIPSGNGHDISCPYVIPDDFIYDAMITDIPGVLLSVRTADCVPVLFWDEEHNAVGAAHCGWRGTLNKLQIKTALKMRELYGTNLQDLKIAIGPCISKCCYEVSADFYGNFVNTLGESVRIYFEEKENQKYMCDLKGINKMLLSEFADENNIEISRHCTCCEEELFFSHRRQGENRGTHASFIGVL